MGIPYPMTSQDILVFVGGASAPTLVAWISIGAEAPPTKAFLLQVAVSGKR
jgi:hypothetical protein